MSESRENTILERLTAFADGELDAAQSLKISEHLVDHPEALRWVRDQQHLAVAARRVIESATPRVPAGLRERLTALPQSARPASNDGPVVTFQPRSSLPRNVGWWGFAAAAVLLVFAGIWIGRGTSATPPVVISHPQVDVIPAAIVAHATRVHSECSRLAAGLHSAGYPQDQGELAKDVEQDLHSTKPYPDLGSIGFRYIGAGPCAEPLAGTIHLLYKSVAPGPPQAVSLFVQRFTGQFGLEPSRVYSVSVAQSPFPMLVWRTANVVYFLLADNEKTEQEALSLIRKINATTQSVAAERKLFSDPRSEAKREPST